MGKVKQRRHHHQHKSNVRATAKHFYNLVIPNFRDESEIVKVQAASEEDIDIAVKAARAAFKSWRNVPGTDRGKLLYKLSQLAEEHKDILATIDTWDNGKPYGDAIADIEEVIEVFRVRRNCIIQHY